MNALSSTLYQLFADNLGPTPDKVALIDADRSVTYADLGGEVDRIAGYLIRQGIVPGERVIVHLRKGITEVAAMLAVAKAGGVVVNVNTQWTPDQLDYVAQDCGAKLMIVERRTSALLAVRPKPGIVRRILVAGVAPDGPLFDSWTCLTPVPTKPERPRLDTELAMIIYTSGSTGRPKGVMLSHRNILAGARSVARYLKLDESDRLLSVLPYSFDAGLNQLTTMLLVGGSVVHQPVALPAEIVRMAAEHRVTGIAGVPTLWSGIVRMLDQTQAALPDLRRVTNTGGKIALGILERMPAVFPEVDIYLMYGLTESFRSTYLDPAKFARKMGSIGQAIPGAEIYVIKADGGIAGPGEEGELVHRGPLVSLGYWGRPDVTAEKIRPCPDIAHLIGEEAVVYSGDVVRVDEDGDLWFVGRRDAMIKTSGFRLSPEEIEDVVYASGQVSEAVAFGVEDDDLGHAIHVAVTPLPAFDEAALVKHCRTAMPAYMVPRRWHIGTAPMPLTASGKLDRPRVIRNCTEPTAQVGG